MGMEDRSQARNKREYPLLFGVDQTGFKKTDGW